MRYSLLAACLLTFIGSLLPACGSRWPRPESFVRPPEGVISDTGITIDDDQDRFRLVSRRPFRTPFWAYDCPRKPDLTNHELGRRLGAQRVTVRHPGGQVHGLLAFCMVHPETSGPPARMYDVRVPEEKILAASGGRVSLVWEPTYLDLPAWILWMSDRPL